MYNKKSIYEEKKEKANGRNAGRAAAKHGYKKTIFGENDIHSLIYQNAYNEAYDRAAASFNKENKERKNGSDAGRNSAKSGCKRAIFGENDNRSIIYKTAYYEAYDKAAASSSKEEKERNQGSNAGRMAANYGSKRAIFGENDIHSVIYQNAYYEAYDKTIASFSKEEKERKNGSNAGRAAAKHGYIKTIFGENDIHSVIYQNAYNEAYDKAVASSPAEKKRRLTEALGKDDARNSKSKRNFPVTQETPEYEDECSSEFIYPQRNSFSSPSFPDFSMRGMEHTIGYSEKLNPPQEPETVINSVEDLSHYLDSLSSPTPDARPLNSLLLQDNLGVSQTTQPTSLNQPRFYQPLFFSTLVPQEPGIMQEAYIYFMADRIV